MCSSQYFATTPAGEVTMFVVNRQFMGLTAYRFALQHLKYINKNSFFSHTGIQALID